MEIIKIGKQLSNGLFFCCDQVMAGTGDLFVLRLCRFLRKRVGLTYGAGFYGSHLAHAMATGLLFLGGGK